MMRAIFRFAVSLLLLPLCAAVFLATLEVFRQASGTDALFSPPAYAFAAGYVAWVLTWFCFKAPVRAYVLGHELTHALWGLLFGARVGRMRVSENGGSVMLSKSNVWISLAPYFFPFYTLLATGIYLLAAQFVDTPLLRLVFLFLVAYTLGFHMTFTFVTLRVRQPDIMEHGRLFSWVVIWLLNILEAGFWITILTPVRLDLYLEELCQCTVASYTLAWHFFQTACNTARPWMMRFFD